MANRADVISVGLTKFEKPGRRDCDSLDVGRAADEGCSELTWQLRGAADSRQVDEPRIGRQHNLVSAAPRW